MLKLVITIRDFVGMKNNFAINEMKKNISIVALFFISATSVSAQSQNSQTTTLLEVQALRQEVAELRDMVERQQYELRKMQRELKQTASKATVQPSIVSQQQAPSLQNSLVLSDQTGTGEALLNTPTADSATSLNTTTSTETNTAAIVKLVTEGDIANSVPAEIKTPASVISSTGDGVSAVSDSGRVYPPVLEIDLSGSKSAVTEASTSGTATQVTNPTSTVSTVTSATASTSAPTTAAIIENRAGETAAAVLEPVNNAPQVLDIKPVETIGAKPVLSIPSNINTSVNSAELPAVSAPAVTQQATLQAKLDVVSEKDYYQQGFDLLKESKHEEAVTIFKRQIQSYPKGSLADDAYYWIAESMYVNRKLDISKENFKALIQGYPESQRAPDAMLKLAYIEQEQGNIIEARILLQEIIQFHPKSDAALSAKNRLSEIN